MKRMTKNVGKIDRIVRNSIGLAILVFGMVFRSWWGLIGFIPIITAYLSFCPLYAILGCKTNSKESV